MTSTVTPSVIEPPADGPRVAVVERLHRVAEVRHVPRAGRERRVEGRDVGVGVSERDDEAALHELLHDRDAAGNLRRERRHPAPGRGRRDLEERAERVRVGAVEEVRAVEGAAARGRDERPLEVQAERQRALAVALGCASSSRPTGAQRPRPSRAAAAERAWAGSPRRRGTRAPRARRSMSAADAVTTSTPNAPWMWRSTKEGVEEEFLAPSLTIRLASGGEVSAAATLSFFLER